MRSSERREGEREKRNTGGHARARSKKIHDESQSAQLGREGWSGRGGKAFARRCPGPREEIQFAPTHRPLAPPWNRGPQKLAGMPSWRGPFVLTHNSAAQAPAWTAPVTSSPCRTEQRETRRGERVRRKIARARGRRRERWHARGSQPRHLSHKKHLSKRARESSPVRERKKKECAYMRQKKQACNLAMQWPFCRHLVLPA